MEEIKAIETYYNGYKFRSRLEARWAVFFDACGIEWEYEPEGYDLGDGYYYLPDFLLHNVKYLGGYGDDSYNIENLYVEVKGTMQPYDVLKLAKFGSKLAEYHKGTFFVVGSLPIWNEEKLDFISKHQIFDVPEPVFTETGIGTIGIFEASNTLELIPISEIDHNELDCFPNEAIFVKTDHNFGLASKLFREIVVYEQYYTIEALNKARQARFEHGEKP